MDFLSRSCNQIIFKSFKDKQRVYSQMFLIKNIQFCPFTYLWVLHSFRIEKSCAISEMELVIQ